METNQPDIMSSGDDWYNYFMQQNHPTLANIVKNVADYGDNGTQTPSAYPNTQGQNAIQAQNVPPAGALVMAAQQQSSGLPQPPASNQASNNPLQALISSLNNNGQGTVLNASQQPMGTQQQQAPVSQDQYGQYLTQAQTQQQFPQTGLVPKGLQNQQQQMQQKANPQGQQNPYTTLVNQQLSQLQGDIYNERNTPYTTTNPDGTVSISYGDSSKLKDLNSQYHDLLTGQQDLWNKQQAGVASGKLEQAKLQEDLQKNINDNTVAPSLEKYGNFLINPKTDAVFNSDGSPATPGDSVLAAAQKAGGAGLSGNQMLTRFSANLDQLNNLMGNLPKIDNLGDYTVQNANLLTQPNRTTPQIASFNTQKTTVAMTALKAIENVTGRPSTWTMQQMEHALPNWDDTTAVKQAKMADYQNLVKTAMGVSGGQTYNSPYGTSNANQNQVNNTQTGNQTNNTQNNTQSQEGQTGTWRGQKVIMRNGQWQLQ